ncbi:hypothetical protein [Methanoculleus sp. MH98A]|uniref:hypothetical protein n=2 Tax=Methanoculleus sp. MH98A TaxID=1495314 RepID=UPI0012DF5739|nr:hypothetical protein [Methanoculleus sp. MH98A]
MAGLGQWDHYEQRLAILQGRNRGLLPVSDPQLTVMAPAEVREIQSEFRQRMQAHSEILTSLVSENILLKKGLEVVKKLQVRMDRISIIVAGYEIQEEK